MDGGRIEGNEASNLYPFAIPIVTTHSLFCVHNELQKPITAQPSHQKARNIKGYPMKNTIVALPPHQRTRMNTDLDGGEFL